MHGGAATDVRLSADTSRSVLQTLHARQDQQPSMVGTASRNVFFLLFEML